MADGTNPEKLRRDAGDAAAGSSAPAADAAVADRSNRGQGRQDSVACARLPDDSMSGWYLLTMCEIGNFREIRQQLGRIRSNQVIAVVRNRVESLVPGMTISATGRSTLEIEGDLASAAMAQQVLDAVQNGFRDPLLVDGQPIAVRVCAAGATCPRHACDEMALVEAAETALKRARGTTVTELIDLTRPDAAIDRRALMRELPAAIEAGQLFLAYQPKIHLRRQCIASAEALIRWRHPSRGLILPNDFIRAAEESGGIAPLTVWTLRQVIADQRLLRARGHDFTIFINISGQLLADRGFVDTVREILLGSGAAIGFEITETSVIRDPDSAIAHLRLFADLGIPLAIDDYGAGLSSLSYLKQLPARELKIDKLFVTQLTSSNRDPLIVRSTIDLAHALDMEVTAEGVESPAALALLSVMGCDMAQGYLISRPIEIAAFIVYCDDERHLDIASAARPGFGNPASFWRRSG